MITLLFLFSVVTSDTLGLPTVDVAELNRYGEYERCQLILWDWSYESDCYVVVAWRVITTQEQLRDELSRIEYKQYREIKSHEDREVANREVLPISKRRQIRWLKSL